MDATEWRTVKVRDESSKRPGRPAPWYEVVLLREDWRSVPIHEGVVIYRLRQDGSRGLRLAPYHVRAAALRGEAKRILGI